MIIFILLLGSLLTSTVNANDRFNVGLPSIVFDLRSGSDGDLRDVMVDVLETTRSHLDKHFTEYWETEDIEGQFEYVELSVKQFDVGGRHLQEHSMAIMYHGVSFYANEQLPEHSLVSAIVTDSFKGDARDEFVDALVNSKLAFLANLAYMVIAVDDVVIANEDFSHRAPTSSSTDTATSETTPWWPIACVASAGAGILIAIAILIYIWRLNKEENFLNLPEKNGARKDLDLEIKSTKSPSPEKSIVSQESSKFTYNPRGKSSKSTLLPSRVSRLQVDPAQPMNIHAWQNSSISPITPVEVPFCTDISAIEDEEKRDLSMVEECASSQERSSNSGESSNASAFNGMSKSSLLNLVERSSDPPRRQTNNLYSMSTDDSNVLSEISLTDDGSDIINDLKNLSVQFQHRRSGR